MAMQAYKRIPSYGSTTHGLIRWTKSQKKDSQHRLNNFYMYLYLCSYLVLNIGLMHTFIVLVSFDSSVHFNYLFFFNNFKMYRDFLTKYVSDIHNNLEIAFYYSQLFNDLVFTISEIPIKLIILALES